MATTARPRTASTSHNRSLCLSLVCFTLLACLTGCAGLVTSQFSAPLRATLEDTADIDLLAAGLPSLLLLHDALRQRYPHDRQILRDGVRAWASYSRLLAVLGKEEAAARAADRAAGYADDILAGLFQVARPGDLPVAELERRLGKIGRDRVADLFWGALGRAVWIEHQGGSPAAMAWLARVQRLMARVVELDEGYMFGGAHIFLGACYATLPPMAGGDVERSRRHFERALEIGNRRYLLAQVTYAETYARRTLNRELFTSLLQEVLATTPAGDPPGAGAANGMARRRAADLLARSSDLFD